MSTLLHGHGFCRVLQRCSHKLDCFVAYNKLELGAKVPRLCKKAQETGSYYTNSLKTFREQPPLIFDLVEHKAFDVVRNSSLNTPIPLYIEWKNTMNLVCQ